MVNVLGLWSGILRAGRHLDQTVASEDEYDFVIPTEQNNNSLSQENGSKMLYK